MQQFCSAMSLNEIARALISMMARSTTLQSKAGYIDARPLTGSSTKSTCDARPDHTYGLWSQPVDATLIVDRKARERKLMSEKCRPELTAARETGSFGIAGSRGS